jgi:hypothetical protein
MEQKVKFFKHDGKWMKLVPQSEFLKSEGLYCEGCIANYDSKLCFALRGCGGVLNASIFQYPTEEELSKLPKG